VLASLSAMLTGRWTPATFTSLAMTSIAAAGVYALVMAPVLLQPPLGIYVRQRLPFLFARDLPVPAHGTANT
jgi:hypothetical protein